MHVSTSPPAVTVGFDPTTYSVTEGGSVDVTLRASSNFSVPFNVTLTSDGDEGMVASEYVCTYVCMCLCTCMHAPCASIQYACVTLVCVYVFTCSVTAALLVPFM